MAHTTYDHISSNNFKTTVLLLLFPLSVVALFFVILFVLLFLNAAQNTEVSAIFNETAYYTLHFGFWTWLAAFIWMMFVLFNGSDMMLAFAGAKKLNKNTKENKHIYNLVENTALAAGLPCPTVYVIEDDSLNAFATGYEPKKSSVALTSGIIKKLSPTELQGVIAHEMAHIGNRDCRLHALIIAGIGIFGFLAEFLVRANIGGSNRSSKSSSRSDGSGKLILIIIAVIATLYIFHTIVAPILRFAVLRTREYAADATAALITRNPQALADALKKISTDSRVEVLDSSKQMAIACIQNPLKMDAFSLTQTHPPIQERIKRLEEMAGRISL